ncbi:MAG: pentapeptide repeat-containing protein [Desulfobacteraceae bacterium]|nr:pentapeptide repeat-containing protein [Desulfobacteraceae bacterium]
MNESKQKIKKSEFQALIEKSDNQERRSIKIDLAKAFLLPVTLAFISIIATWSINKQQEKNAEHLALQQIKSAHIIAEANREHSARLSESNQRIERIKHIKGIFQEIIMGKSENSNAMIMQIRSLEVYKEDSLSFLLNIKEHFNNQICAVEGTKNPQKKQKKLDDLVAQTEKTIFNILKNSQIDVAHRIFVDADDPQRLQTEAMGLVEKIEKIKFTGLDRDKYSELVASTNESNMRKQTYDNYNFSNCIFIKTKLYQANFSNCTLKNSIFMDVDLQEANFSGSDLSNAVFINCNLKRINFLKSKLRNTLFFNPILKHRDPAKEFITKNGLHCELEDAKFTLGTLMWTKTPPFSFLKNLGTSEMEEEYYHLYVNLLMPHRQMIEAMKESKDKEWKNLLKEIGVNYSESKLRKDLIREEKRLEKHSTKNKNTSLVSTTPGIGV